MEEISELAATGNIRIGEHQVEYTVDLTLLRKNKNGKLFKELSHASQETILAALKRGDSKGHFVEKITWYVNPFATNTVSLKGCWKLKTLRKYTTLTDKLKIIKNTDVDSEDQEILEDIDSLISKLEMFE